MNESRPIPRIPRRPVNGFQHNPAFVAKLLHGRIDITEKIVCHIKGKM
jgi:hypothetical protein